MDKYEVIVKLWKWLQQCQPEEILRLPILKKGDTINREMFKSDEEFIFVGFLVCSGLSSVRKTVSLFGANSFRRTLNNVASQLFKIRTWDIRLGSYLDLPNIKATWFIDPPYQFGGEGYVESNKNLDYAQLADWCRSRKGQVIVCENTKADWLDFKPMKKMLGANKKFTTEAIWTNFPTNYDYVQQTLF